jgi:hypothetical protein
MILEGEVTLELDDGKVELHPRWRNHGTRPARMVAVMVNLD